MRTLRYYRIRLAAKFAVSSKLVTLLTRQDDEYIRGIAAGRHRLHR